MPIQRAWYMAYILLFPRQLFALNKCEEKKTFLKTKAISVSSELNNNFKTVLSITSFINCIYNIISFKFWANILNNQSHIIEVSIAPVSFRQDKKMIEVGSNKNRSVYHVKATINRDIFWGKAVVVAAALLSIIFQSEAVALLSCPQKCLGGQIEHLGRERELCHCHKRLGNCHDIWMQRERKKKFLSI